MRVEKSLASESDRACPLSTSQILTGSIDDLLGREWLLTNQRGAFVSGTVIGCPTRRYHGLLVAPKVPPLQRHLLLAGMLETLTCGPHAIELATFEFSGAIHPKGYRFLTDFAFDNAAADPWARFVYAYGPLTFRRQITLARELDMVRIEYRVTGPADEELELELSPLLAMRDFHGLRLQAAEDPWTIAKSCGGLWVQDRLHPDITLYMSSSPGEGLIEAELSVEPQWWHNFRYRVELERGFECGEDLQKVGSFRAKGKGELRVCLLAVAFPVNPPQGRELADEPRADEPRALARADTPPANEPRGLTPAARGDEKANDPIRRTLAAAADQFIVRRAFGPQGDSATILAGYPWFGDWGRDAFIALEGLLLVTGRFAEAREVLATFAGKQRNGLIPNRFEDYGDECSYNSVDASLWFIHAAHAYMRYTKDADAWSSFLSQACHNVVEGFRRGTDFGIAVDDRGLVRCGDPRTQITWMDAKVDGVPVTPRHGFPVEVNALWYSALSCLIERARQADDARAEELSNLAAKVERHFLPTFWNAADRCLYDCIGDDGPDAAIRPNQIFAVSLPHSPLAKDNRKAVLECVSHHLLTPYGLRSLSPADSRYCGRHQGSPQARDRAYHSGTVWSWLIGPHIEAYLRVNGSSPKALAQARRMLKPLLDHLSGACLGTISEIFDGDPPHHPRGCVAQAWSVAEVLRAYDMTHKH